MKNINLILIQICLYFGCAEKSLAQIPKYYYNITDVSTTSYSFENESDNRDMRFRALTIQPAEYSFIVIELMELGEGDFRKIKLKDSYYLRDSNFNLIVINEVEYLDWLSPKKLKIQLNGTNCYIVNLENYKAGIEINACSN